RVERAAGEQHGIELLGVGVFERHVDGEALVLLVVFHALDLRLGRDERRIRASLLEGKPRKRELLLLDAISREDRHAYTFEDQVFHGRTSRAHSRKEGAPIRSS